MLVNCQLFATLAVFEKKKEYSTERCLIRKEKDK